jgi:hypothetical protein
MVSEVAAAKSAEVTATHRVDANSVEVPAATVAGNRIS